MILGPSLIILVPTSEMVYLNILGAKISLTTLGEQVFRAGMKSFLELSNVSRICWWVSYDIEKVSFLGKGFARMGERTGVLSLVYEYQAQKKNRTSGDGLSAFTEYALHHINSLIHKNWAQSSE